MINNDLYYYFTDFVFLEAAVFLRIKPREKGNDCRESEDESGTETY